MTKLTRSQLIVDPPCDGAWNMALDEALLLSAERDGIAALRFYRWQEPTLSLGYFQSHAERAAHAASKNCAPVRRASGGGAILHDRELTYSIALPPFHQLAHRTEKLYFAAHETLIESLVSLHIDAISFKPNPEAHSPASREPFLCFQRHVLGDVLIGNCKVAGSAQRRHRGAVLQHGSVLLARSEFAPELPGIEDLTSVQITSSSLRELWQPRLADRLGLDLDESIPTKSLLCEAEKIAQSKFASKHWTMRR